jgi:RimJ/RimL family protein N-acetyltransferase
VENLKRESAAGEAITAPLPVERLAVAEVRAVVPIEFDTERLRLRQWCDADREPFAALNADSKVMEFFPAVLERAESDATAQRCQELIAERGWGFWAVETKSTREFIGFVGLHTPEPELPFSPCVEIGWRLAAKHWGQGFATEAARGALRVGFEQLGLPEIVSFTTVGNSRSRAVMERLGMREAPNTFEYPQLPAGSLLRQHCLYRLSREQWLAHAHHVRLPADG